MGISALSPDGALCVCCPLLARCYRDLKPDNILCTLSSDDYDLARDSSGRALIKLTDFGTCKFIGGDERYAIAPSTSGKYHIARVTARQAGFARMKVKLKF